MLKMIKDWGGLAVVSSYDPPTDTWMFIALHDDTLGTPVGGCRMKVYDDPRDGLQDALRLAEGMTHKWAAIDFSFGGGKSVLALGRNVEGEERTALLRRFGGLLNSLHGTYRTGEDLGTTPADMKVLAEASPYVMGGHSGGDGPMDPGPFTALGVMAGIRAALRHRFGSDALEGRTVLVQGVGDVGAPLARMVREAGGSVLVSDIDSARANAVAGEVDASIVPPETVYGTPCDVYAPCAVGATLNPTTIPELACRIVAGSANNQLRSPADADLLRERGILYAPDYVVNAGGAMAFGWVHRGITDRAELQRRVEGIGRSLEEIFSEAEGAGTSPLEAARRRVERALSTARREGRKEPDTS